MSWISGYSQTLNGDSPLGASFNYVAEIPAIPSGAGYVRIGMRGPSSGLSRVQAMFIGHGSGYSFDGDQAAITVGGQPSFTLSSGLTYSDPILADDFGFDTSKPILLAYELLNGDAYRRNNSASGCTLYYKAGAGDASATSKSGYTTQSSRTALLESIQFAAEVPIEEDPPQHEEPPLNSADQVLSGERHSSGEVLAGEAGKHLHIQFRNPSTSGKIGLLYELEITPDADTVLSFRSHVAAIGSAFPIKCNLYFGFGQALMECRYSHESSILGVFHSIHKLKGGQRSIIRLDVPLVALNPGNAVVMALHSPGVGAVANIQWREVGA